MGISRTELLLHRIPSFVVAFPTAPWKWTPVHNPELSAGRSSTPPAASNNGSFYGCHTVQYTCYSLCASISQRGYFCATESWCLAQN